MKKLLTLFLFWAMAAVCLGSPGQQAVIYENTNFTVMTPTNLFWTNIQVDGSIPKTRLSNSVIQLSVPPATATNRKRTATLRHSSRSPRRCCPR